MFLLRVVSEYLRMYKGGLIAYHFLNKIWRKTSKNPSKLYTNLKGTLKIPPLCGLI
jgi:hypothetical protein